MHFKGRRIPAGSLSVAGFRLTVFDCSKCIHVSSQPVRLTARWPPQDGQPMGWRRLPRISAKETANAED